MRAALIAAAMLTGIACHQVPAWDDPPEGLRITAETHLIGRAGDTLQVWMSGRNVSRQLQQFPHSTCPDVTIRIASERLIEGKPAHIWDYEHMRYPDLADGTVMLICSTVASTLVQPGDSATIVFVSVAVASILGDSLPAGRYRVTAFPRIYLFSGVDAGAVELRSPSAPVRE